MNETEWLNQNMISYLRISPLQIERAREIIEREFGTEWLSSLSGKYHSGARSPLSSFHPIYDGLLSVAINPITLDIIELSTYLEFLRNAVEHADEALPRLVEELRDQDKFHDYLFQLMVTARLRLIVSTLQMEIVIESRKPDIAFQYKSREFIVEVTRLNESKRLNSARVLLERCFFWLVKAHENEQVNLNFHLTLRTADLNGIEKELRTALLQASAVPSSRIVHDAFELNRYDFDGSVQDFNAIHGPLAEEGKELMFVAFRTKSLPIPPALDLEHRAIGITLVADLTAIDDEAVYRDVADKLDDAVRKKVNRLKLLQSDIREIYVFLEIAGTVAQRQLDLGRIVPRLKTNIFDKYPDLLKGVILCIRSWNADLRRNQMLFYPIYAPGEQSDASKAIFHLLRHREMFNDFIGTIVGWGETDDAPCSCASGKNYGECCMGIRSVRERMGLLK